MEEGFVRFMRRWYYWVGIAIAIVATLFGVFYPAIAVFMIFLIIGLALFFAWHYHKYELLKKERHPVRKVSTPMLRVEEVESEMSRMPDLDAMAAEAARGPAQVRANILEGSGMDLVERYLPLGEMLFPISFIADRGAEQYQEGSLEIGAPVCLWHTQPVWFSPAVSDEGIKFLYHCPKCPQGGKAISKSLEETTKAVELIATSTLRSGKMPMMDESLMDAIKRGRGELPG